MLSTSPPLHVVCMCVNSCSFLSVILVICTFFKWQYTSGFTSRPCLDSVILVLSNVENLEFQGGGSICGKGQLRVAFDDVVGVVEMVHGVFLSRGNV